MTKRIRESVPSQPQWDERFRNWTAKFIAKNKWRCDDEFEDLLQDAYLTFRHVRASYPLISEHKHIMALYKSAMINDYNDRAKRRRKKIEAEVSIETLVGVDKRLIDSLGEDNNEGYLRLLLNELPPEVRLALEAFHDSGKLTALREPKSQSRLARLAGLTPKGESLNEMLCRIIRLPKTIDLVGMIRSALTE